MRKLALSIIYIMLNPRTKIEYLWKMLFWCCLTTLVALVVETLIGTEVSSPITTYFLVVVLITVPFFSIGMLVFKRMEALQTELALMASTDMLTGLANRRAFFAALRHPQTGNIALLDIDHFKSVNDRFGHAAGDDVLVCVSGQMHQHLSGLGQLARVGGEEFAIFSPPAHEGPLLQALETLTRGVTVDVEGQSLTVTISVGMAKADIATDISDVMKQADKALYQAKSDGRACLRVWPPDAAAPQDAALTAASPEKEKPPLV